MNTTITTACTTILAIDLGKYKRVACVHDHASGEFTFTTFDTSRAELRQLIRKTQPAVVIIEACLLAGWVHDLCDELHVRCLVANTASEAWKFKHLKRKTDKDDALRLAQLYLLDQLPTVTLPPTAVRQWRSLIACRQALVGRRIAVQNRIRALFVAQGLSKEMGNCPWRLSVTKGRRGVWRYLGRRHRTRQPPDSSRAEGQHARQQRRSSHSRVQPKATAPADGNKRRIEETACGSTTVRLALTCHPGRGKGGIVPPLPLWPLGRRSGRSPALPYPPPRSTS
jgi:hypothetical protein